MGEILKVDREGIGRVENGVPTKRFILEAGKLSNLGYVGVPEKFLKVKDQLYFEFINKVLLPGSEKSTVDSFADLFSHRSFEQSGCPEFACSHYGTHL